MPDESKLKKASDALSAQGQQDELKKPEELDVVGSAKGQHPQASAAEAKNRDQKAS